MTPSPAAVMPGSFDPITSGHLDIIRRATHLFPKVVVAVLKNSEKSGFLPMDDRLDLIRQSTRDLPTVEAAAFDGLLVDFAVAQKARVVIRGLRAVSDFEYEFQMALMNRRLNSQIETVYLTPREEFTYVSSRLIREVFLLGGDIRGLVPPPVATYLENHHD